MLMNHNLCHVYNDIISIYFNIWQTKTDKLREDIKCMACLLNVNFGLRL